MKIKVLTSTFGEYTIKISQEYVDLDYVLEGRRAIIEDLFYNNLIKFLEDFENENNLERKCI